MADAGRQETAIRAVLPGFLSDELRAELTRRVEALFERRGENAGHEFREEPSGRRVDGVEKSGEVFAELAADPSIRRALGQSACRLERMTARSLNPYAPARSESAGGDGWVVVWLLDSTAMGDAGSAIVIESGAWRGWPANPTAWHKRALMALYRR